MLRYVINRLVSITTIGLILVPCYSSLGVESKLSTNNHHEVVDVNNKEQNAVEPSFSVHNENNSYEVLNKEKPLVATDNNHEINCDDTKNNSSSLNTQKIKHDAYSGASDYVKSSVDPENNYKADHVNKSEKKAFPTTREIHHDPAYEELNSFKSLSKGRK